MQTETKVILKYKRAKDCWCCPDCEMENEMISHACAFCGSERDNRAVIFSSWTEARRVQNTTGAQQNHGTPYTGRAPSRPAHAPYEEKKSNVGVWVLLIGAIIILTAIIFASVAGAADVTYCAEKESDTMYVYEEVLEEEENVL